MVSPDLLILMPSDECHGILPVINQHLFREWLGAVSQQAIIWANIDIKLWTIQFSNKYIVVDWDCHNDSPRHKWRQSWHHDNSQFSVKCQDWVEIGSCCRGGHILARSDKIWHVYKVGIINSSQYNATLNNVQYNNAMVPCGSHLTVLSPWTHDVIITSLLNQNDVILT